MAIVKGTVLCANPSGRPYICVPVCLLGIRAQPSRHWLYLGTRHCGSLASMGDRRDPRVGGVPMGAKATAFGYL